MRLTEMKRLVAQSEGTWTAHEGVLYRNGEEVAQFTDKVAATTAAMLLTNGVYIVNHMLRMNRELTELSREKRELIRTHPALHPKGKKKENNDGNDF